MDLPQGEPEIRTLSGTSFAAVGATLVCFAIVPAAFWLADVALIPWADELRWEQLRRADSRQVIDTTAAVELRRTLCFGTCPDYTVTLHASGAVEFDGRYYVCAIGPQTAQVDPVAARELLADLAAADFFGLAWDTGDLRTDNPSAISRLTVDGRTRTIDHYLGDMGAPRVLRHMEDAIDDVAGSARWLRRRVDREYFCPQPDGSLRPVPRD